MRVALKEYVYGKKYVIEQCLKGTFINYKQAINFIY